MDTTPRIVLAAVASTSLFVGGMLTVLQWNVLAATLAAIGAFALGILAALKAS